MAPTAKSNILSLTKAELGEVSPLSLVMRLVNRADDFQKDAAEIKAHRTKDEKTVRDATARLGQPFALAEQLAEKQQRVREMEQELRKQGEDKPDIRYDLNVTRENAVSHAIDRAIARERGEEVPEAVRTSALLRLRKLEGQLESGEISDNRYIFETRMLYGNLER